MDELQEVMLQIAAMVIAGAFAYGAALLKQKTGIDVQAGMKKIEAGNRDALGSALQTAVTLALGQGLVGKLALDFVLEYARRSSPEAAAMAERAGVLVEKAEAALTAPVIQQTQELIQKAGGVDKLAKALDQAKQWLPPANEGRP